jgi:dihydroflavonol-4-reductase
MRAFVTGATGFVGSQVVKRLVRSGHEVACLVRRGSATSFIEGLGARLVRGDLTDKPSLVAGLAGADWLLNVGAAYSFWARDRRSYRQVNVDGVRNVMEAALETGVSKVVHVSSVVVYGQPAVSPVTEDRPVGPVRFSEYARTKYEGDLVAWALHAERGLPLVTVYPGAILGPNDPKATGQYIQSLIRGRMPATILNDATFPFVHVNDVATGIVRAAEAPGNIGARYFLVGENLTFGIVNQLIAETAGIRLPFMRMPDALAVGMAAVLTALSLITRRPPLFGLSLDQVRTMGRSSVFDGRKAERELGMTYTPVREAIRGAVESYRR